MQDEEVDDVRMDVDTTEVDDETKPELDDDSSVVTQVMGNEELPKVVSESDGKEGESDTSEPSGALLGSESAPSTSKAGSKHSWFLKIAILIAIIGTIYFVSNEMGKADLQKKLARTWYQSEDDIVLQLKVDEDEMEYNLITGYSFLDTTVATFGWRPTGAKAFETTLDGKNWIAHTIEFSDDKDSITVRPAIVSADSYEIWVNID